MSENLDEILNNVYGAVNDWLKFAEQKHAALVVLNGGIIWGVTRIINRASQLPEVSIWMILVGYALVLGAFITSINAYFPVLRGNWFQPGDRKDEDNFLYFNDIAKYDAQGYLSLLCARRKMSDVEALPYHIDFCEQITTNAGIALDKFKKFRLASVLMVLGVILFVVSLSINSLWCAS